MDDLAVYAPNNEVPVGWRDFIAGLGDDGKKAYEDFFYEKELWEKVQRQPTPLHLLKEREGGKRDGIPQILEYFPEEYTLTELNRLFPGWWTDEMKRSSVDEVIQLQSVLVEGYLMIPYPTPSGTKVRKIWGVAGVAVIFKQGSKTPVDLADNFKGARTEWIKIVGKWLGIGLDIYHQRITPELRSSFEDICRSLNGLQSSEDEQLKNHVFNLKKLAGTLSSGQGFRNFLKEQGSPAQISKFYKIIKVLSQEKQDKLWKVFLKFNNKSEAATNQLETWLSDLETKFQAFNNKNKGED
jgi:hypothetical protein